jgi:hypothetical protein
MTAPFHIDLRKVQMVNGALKFHWGNWQRGSVEQRQDSGLLRLHIAAVFLKQLGPCFASARVPHHRQSKSALKLSHIRNLMQSRLLHPAPHLTRLQQIVNYSARSMELLVPRYLPAAKTTLLALAFALTAAATAHALDVTVPYDGNIATYVTDVGNAGGGTVTLKSGTYQLISPILIQSNTTIIGKGASTIILAPDTPHGWSMIQNASEGITNVTFKNLVLDGNIPKGAYLPTGDSPYGGAGIYLFAYNAPITNVTISNVEIRNAGLGMLTGSVNGLVMTNDYIHDNDPGSFAHNAYFVATYDVTITRSRFDNSHGGDGLHFDFGASNYTISKSEFSGNVGEGVLDQGDSGIVIEDSVMNFNGLNPGGSGENGIDAYSNNVFDTRLQTIYNGGYGIQHLGGSGNFTGFETFGNVSGPFNIEGVGGYGTNVANVSFGLTPNVYPAVLAAGALGPADTADWSTQYGGYTMLGEVDFNAHHLFNGKLIFQNVGVVGAGTTQVSLRYSNGAGKTLLMPLTVNGKSVGTLAFPPTASWSDWSTVTASLPMNDGANVIQVTPQLPKAPELDELVVNTPVPSPPAAACPLTATANSPYAVTLTWPATPGASGYSILRAGSAAGPFKMLTTGLTANTYQDAEILLGGAAYTYQVVAYNQGGNAAACTATVTTQVDAPAGLQAASASGGIALNWITANGSVGYKVKRATDGVHFSTIATVTNTTSVDSSNYEQTYTDSTANLAATNTYVVSSVGPHGGNSPNSYKVTVPGTP